jgi:crossover junction endodeoxyribonuclease RuvC
MNEKNPFTDVAYIGLDLSLTGTGFCIKRGTELNMMTVKTTPKTAPNDLARLQYIRDYLISQIPAYTAMICVEDFFVPHRPSQINAAKGLIMLGTVVRIALLERGLPFYIVSPPQLKKYATGKGNGPKGLVIREIYKRWGVDANDDNQADACVLAHIAEAIHTKPGNLHKYQQDTVDKVVEERPHYNIP